MDEQSRPVGPQDGRNTEDASRKAAEEQGAGVPAAEQTGKLRPASYLDPRGSESTRELRDTARRRRDAEEKLQQHLMEAKHHVPNEFHEHHGHGQQGTGHLGSEFGASHQPEHGGTAEHGGSAEHGESGDKSENSE